MVEYTTNLRGKHPALFIQGEVFVIIFTKIIYFKNV